jgi:transcriptional regulator with XRE-family HTH domain
VEAAAAEVAEAEAAEAEATERAGAARSELSYALLAHERKSSFGRPATRTLVAGRAYWPSLLQDHGCGHADEQQGADPRPHPRVHSGVQGVEAGGDAGPIPDLGLRRIESGDRRVDADDLMALAVALDVSPVTLLMPAGVDMPDPVQVTGLGEPAAAIGVWAWIQGRFARPGLPADSRGFQQISVDTWPLWEQEHVLGQFAGRADGDD